MGDVLGVFLTVLLLGANAFFVGAEFALISARRDRLEALAEQGKHSAVTVIRAGQNLSQMLAGAQLGITDLFDPARPGRRARGGAPAGEAVRTWSASPTRCCTRCRSSSRSRSSWCCTCCSGEMVPKNIAIAGPESVAMLLVPPYLLWVRAARPGHRVLRLVCPHDPARVRRPGEDRTGEHGFDRRAVRDDRRIAVGGPAGSRGAQPVVAGPADPQPRGRRRRRSAAARSGRCRWPPKVPGRPSGPSSGHWPRPATPASRWSTRPAQFVGYLHIKDVLPLVDDPDAVVESSMVRPLPQVPETLPLPDALSRLRRDNSHLALVTGPDGA